jgi:hypothetical protein
VTRCGACGFDWQAEADEVINAISQFGPEYRARIAPFTAAPHGSGGRDVVRTRPEPTVWSALEYVAHMRDVLGFYLDRIDRVLLEDRPAMTATDFASLAEARRYQDEDLAVVLDAVDHAALTTAQRLRQLRPEDWLRVGIGSEGGERTVLTLARRLAHDGQHHLMDLDRVRTAVVPR